MEKGAFIKAVPDILTEMQQGMLDRARAYRDENLKRVEDVTGFKKHFRKKGNPGFLLAFAHDTDSYEPLLKDLKVTARCMPLSHRDERGTCIFTGEANAPVIVFGKAY